jgi:hypothetical protein
MKLSTLITAAALAVAAIPAAVQAQQPTQSPGMSALPPALRAAVQSGNAQVIQQAITALAAGNPTQAASLAASVARAAEALLATNPAAAAAAASAALNVVKSSAVQSANPAQTQEVLLVVARISASPIAQQFNSTLAGGLAADVRSIVAANQALQSPQISAALPRSFSTNTAQGSGPSGSPASSGSSGGSGGGGTSAR